MGRKSEAELFDQLIKVYQDFHSKAHMEQTQDGPRRVFRGSPLEIFEAHGLAGTSYVRVRTEMVDLGCVEVKSQGNRHTPSVWWINAEPTADAYQEVRMHKVGQMRPLTRPARDALLAQHGARIHALEQTVAQLARYLPTIEN